VFGLSNTASLFSYIDFVSTLNRGLATILELQNAILCSISDVLSRPMRWGVPTEMGLNYPSTYMYFPGKNRELLAVLVGPISCAGFLDLFSCISSEIEQETPAKIIDDDSSWYDIFCSLLLFVLCTVQNMYYHSKWISKTGNYFGTIWELPLQV
jgi:hypothetical protein